MRVRIGAFPRFGLWYKVLDKSREIFSFHVLLIIGIGS